MSENQIPEDDKKPYSSLLARMREQREAPRTQSQVDWIKSLFNLPIQDPLTYNWDKAEPSTYSTIPPELSDELFDSVMDSQVMVAKNRHTFTSNEVEAGGTEDGHRINDLLLDIIDEDDEIRIYDYYIFDLINSFSESIAIAIDQCTTSSININSFIGLVPNNASDKDNKIPDELKAIREAVTVVDKLHNSITPKDLVVFQNIYKKQFGDGSIKNAKWYFNSMTALEIANLKNDDGSFWIKDRTDIDQVGVPSELMGSEIVYNEYMKELYDDRDVCIIYGNLDNVYYLGFYPDVRIIRTDPGVSDKGGKLIGFTAQLKVSGDVDLTGRIDGKLPYIALRNVITGGNSKETIPDPDPEIRKPDNEPSSGDNNDDGNGDDDGNNPESWPELEEESELMPEFA